MHAANSLDLSPTPVLPAPLSLLARRARGDNNLVYNTDASGRLIAAPAVDEPLSEEHTTEPKNEQ